MRFDASEVSVALCDAVAAVLRREVTPAVIRAAGEGDRLPSAAAWRHIAATGVVGTLVPDSAGGIGLDENSLVLVMEALGYSGMPGPVVETIALAAPLLTASTDPAARAVLEEVLSGSAVVAAAPDPAYTGHPGERQLVPYAAVAQYLLIGTSSSMALRRRTEVDLVAARTVDPTRSAALVTVAPHAPPPLLTLRADPNRSWHRGVLATSACLVGLARRMLDMTVGYTGQRRQFGVPIGSFQAVKHALAEALLAVEFARPLVLAAAWAVAEGHDDAGRLVSAAKVQASDAARLVARTSIQCHGALGYTTEYDLHLFAKRSWALAACWGDPSWHRATLARSLEVASV